MSDPKQANVERLAMIRCPGCAAESIEILPTDACVYFWICPACNALVKPKPGDCCVACSYGSVRCPPAAARLEDLDRVTVRSDPPSGLTLDHHAEAKDAVLELREFLIFGGHLSGPELAAGVGRRVDRIAQLPAAEHEAITAKLLALREWVQVFGSPAELAQHGGTATVRSLLLADCGVMYCYLAGPPDASTAPDPQEAVG